MHLKSICFVLATSLVAATPISASAADSTMASWNASPFTIKFKGTAVKPEMVGVALDAEMVVASAPDVAGNLGFLCLNGRFGAAVSSKPVDLSEAIPNAWDRDQVIRAVKPRVTINGKSTANSVWTYSKKLGILEPQSKKVVTKLYNAVIRGEDVYVQASGIKKTKLIMPKSNADFANFGAECGIGLKAQKS